jgi:hypothetical protein
MWIRNWKVVRDLKEALNWCKSLVAIMIKGKSLTTADGNEPAFCFICRTCDEVRAHVKRGILQLTTTKMTEKLKLVTMLQTQRSPLETEPLNALAPLQQIIFFNWSRRPLKRWRLACHSTACVKIRITNSAQDALFQALWRWRITAGLDIGRRDHRKYFSMTIFFHLVMQSKTSYYGTWHESQ